MIRKSKRENSCSFLFPPPVSFPEKEEVNEEEKRIPLFFSHQSRCQEEEKKEKENEKEEELP